MTDRWMEEARKMAISLGRDYPDVVERIANRFSDAYEAGRREERERVSFDVKRFTKAPCYLCGYNGHSYYQPSVHKCAEIYHAAIRSREAVE